MYDYTNIVNALENMYNIQPGTIISYNKPIKFLEKTPIGLYETTYPIKKRNSAQNFMILRILVMCEDWRSNLCHLFPELQIRYYDSKQQKQLIGDRYIPLTPCVEIFLNEKIYYIDVVDFFLDILAAQIKVIS